MSGILKFSKCHFSNLQRNDCSAKADSFELGYTSCQEGVEADSTCARYDEMCTSLSAEESYERSRSLQQGGGTQTKKSLRNQDFLFGQRHLEFMVVCWCLQTVKSDT